MAPSRMLAPSKYGPTGELMYINRIYIGKFDVAVGTPGPECLCVWQDMSFHNLSDIEPAKEMELVLHRVNHHMNLQVTITECMILKLLNEYYWEYPPEYSRPVRSFYQVIRKMEFLHMSALKIMQGYS